ncbi:hypothetical protein K456DRAFT_1332633 [Colletotrichum gloeosporioides 23]|nr:hypothetical protein K456DRAFT_1332633 [Colletotrichum gloeosporioides 23]
MTLQGRREAPALNHPTPAMVRPRPTNPPSSIICCMPTSLCYEYTTYASLTAIPHAEMYSCMPDCAHPRQDPAVQLGYKQRRRQHLRPRRRALPFCRGTHWHGNQALPKPNEHIKNSMNPRADIPLRDPFHIVERSIGKWDEKQRLNLRLGIAEQAPRTQTAQEHAMQPASHSVLPASTRGKPVVIRPLVFCS